MKPNIHSLLSLAEFFLRMGNVEKTETHFIVSNFFFLFFFFPPFENCAVHESWKNNVEPNRPQMTIRCTGIACCVTKATKTRSKRVILTAFPLQQWLDERPSTLRYTYTVFFHL